MNGFFILDKPAGITSHDVVSRVRRILGTRKVGHTGTLDPFATGVLPVAVNEGTKAIPFLDEGIKCYEALMRLGVTTDTLDITGRVVQEADWSGIDRPRLEALLVRFTGHISQVPPMYSAVKRDGQPLYKLARQGVEVERPPRQVEIGTLEIISFEPPLVGLRIVCSRGTYIRSLADDMGSALGCGATLQELRRTTSGPFHISKAVSLEALEDACRDASLDRCCVSPMEALSHLADIPLSDDALIKVRHGRSPAWEETGPLRPVVSEQPVLVRLSHDGALVAVGQLVPVAGGPPRIVVKRVFV
jgi:tRNA pseudouridine55 synthase